MTISIPTKNGTVAVAECQVRAVLRRAEESATWVAAVLDAIGATSPNGEERKARFPAGFLLELSAVLQLAAWEYRGQRHHIDARLQSFNEAAAELARRVKTAPADFLQLASATLHRRVLSFCLEKIAWQGLDLLEADVLVGDIDEEAFLDGLAAFLWSNRRQLSSQLPQRESDT